MTIEEFIEDLKLPFDATKTGNEYNITLDNSDDFSKLYSAISINNKLELDDDNTISTDSNVLFIFTDGYFELVITGDFNKDIYRVVIRSR